MRRPTLLSIFWLVTGGACTPNFDKVWQIQDLRVLAIKAEPPEVLVPIPAGLDISDPATLTPEQLALTLAGALAAVPPIAIEALVVDPRTPDGQVSWEVWACSGEEPHCDAAQVKKQHLEQRTSAMNEIRFEYPLDLQLLRDALEADEFKGFGGIPLMLELRLKGDPEVRAVKRLVYGLTDPADKLPNKNPSLSTVTHSTPLSATGTSIPATGWSVKAGQAVRIEPKPTIDEDTNRREALAACHANVPVGATDGCAPGECYIVRTFLPQSDSCLCRSAPLGSCVLKEYISYSFFVTSGDLSHARTGGKPSALVENKKISDVTVEWTPPETSGSGTLWIVVRDDRGGMSWNEYPYRIK